MQIIPDDYYRIIHFTDPVPDVPSQLLGFKHAGTEIWYFSPLNTDNSFKECLNRIFEPENRECSHTLFVRPFFEDHRVYLNEKLSLMCDRFEEPNLLARHEE